MLMRLIALAFLKACDKQLTLQAFQSHSEVNQRKEVQILKSVLLHQDMKIHQIQKGTILDKRQTKYYIFK